MVRRPNTCEPCYHEREREREREREESVITTNSVENMTTHSLQKRPFKIKNKYKVGYFGSLGTRVGRVITVLRECVEMFYFLKGLAEHVPRDTAKNKNFDTFP